VLVIGVVVDEYTRINWSLMLACLGHHFDKRWHCVSVSTSEGRGSHHQHCVDGRDDGGVHCVHDVQDDQVSPTSADWSQIRSDDTRVHCSVSDYA